MGATTIELDEKSYGQLLRRALPRVIDSVREELARLTEELERLDDSLQTTLDTADFVRHIARRVNLSQKI